MPITEPIDEDELEADLAALEQENLDEKMLKTGTMPVADSLNRLPKAANGERKSRLLSSPLIVSINRPGSKKGKEEKRKYRLTRYSTCTQSKGNRKRRSKKRTRRRNCGSCRRRWPCERYLRECGRTDRIFHSAFFVICIKPTITPFDPPFPGDLISLSHYPTH